MREERLDEGSRINARGPARAGRRRRAMKRRRTALVGRVRIRSTLEQDLRDGEISRANRLMI